MTPPQTGYKHKFAMDRHPDPAFVPDAQQVRVLEHLWQYGMLAEHHIKELEGVKWRRVMQIMQPLFNNGYINKPNAKVRSAYDYMFWWLNRKGAQLVAERLNIEYADLDWQRTPRWSQIEHDVAITDFQLILQGAIKQVPEMVLAEFVHETTFRSWQDQIEYITLEGNKRKRKFYLDAYARVGLLVEGKQQYSRLLIEIEYSDKDNPRFVNEKILPGLAYLNSEIYAKRLLANSGRFLHIIPSQLKMENYRRKAEKALAPTDHQNFYFTTFDRVSTDSILFEPIWLRPGDRTPVSLF